MDEQVMQEGVLQIQINVSYLPLQHYQEVLALKLGGVGQIRS
jgi:hypothetical protein